MLVQLVSYKSTERSNSTHYQRLFGEAASRTVYPMNACDREAWHGCLQSDRLPLGRFERLAALKSPPAHWQLIRTNCNEAQRRSTICSVTIRCSPTMQHGRLQASLRYRLAMLIQHFGIQCVKCFISGRKNERSWSCSSWSEYESIWTYLNAYEGIWKHMNSYESYEYSVRAPTML